MTRGQTISGAIELRDSPEIEQVRQAVAPGGVLAPLASEEEVVARLREKMRDALASLDRIASGDVRRNDSTVLKAVELALRFTQPLPKQTVDINATTSITVVDPYAAPPAIDITPQPAALPAAPAVTARAPVVRKRVPPKTQE